MLARGQATPLAPFPRVMLSGQPVVTLATPYAIAGCALTGTPDAALRHRPVARRRGARARRRRAGRDCMTGSSICIPTGTPMLPVVAQTRVLAT